MGRVVHRTVEDIFFLFPPPPKHSRPIKSFFFQVSYMSSSSSSTFRPRKWTLFTLLINSARLGARNLISLIGLFWTGKRKELKKWHSLKFYFLHFYWWIFFAAWPQSRTRGHGSFFAHFVAAQSSHTSSLLEIGNGSSSRSSSGYSCPTATGYGISSALPQVKPDGLGQHQHSIGTDRLLFAHLAPNKWVETPKREKSSQFGLLPPLAESVM